MEGDLKQARHNVRGRLNALKLCVSALELVQTRQELLEFLDMIDQSADRLLVALDRFEKVASNAAGNPPPPSP